MNVPKTALAGRNSLRAVRGESAVSRRAIRRFAAEVARRFRPDKIVLFGSHADGTPNPDSDVDLLVVMPCRDRILQAVRIRMELPVEFPMDLIVRTPTQLADRLRRGDSFLSEIVTRGKVLYEAGDKAVGAKGGERPHCRAVIARQRHRVS